MTRGWLPLLLAGLAAGLTAAPRVARENIEWLDVWIPHTNGRDLPRVLLIGDSITRGYYKPVEEKLAGKAYVARLATSKSLGDPVLLEQVAVVLREQAFDVIHFNNGLHGSGYSEPEYAAAFPELLSVLRRWAPKARLIWATTTGVRMANDVNTVSPQTERVLERNRLAAAIVKREKIPVDDLFTLASGHPEYHAADGIHFTAEGYAVLAGQVSRTILEQLAASR